MMIDPLHLALACIFGLLTGTGYFWVLWRSVYAIAHSTSPWRAALIGGALRLTLLCGSFAILVLLGAKAAALLAWLAGFLVIRILTIKASRRCPLSVREASL